MERDDHPKKIEEGENSETCTLEQEEIETKLCERNLIKELNTWIVSIASYLGQSWN